MHGHVTLCYIVVGGNLNSPLNLFISFAKALMEQGFWSDLFLAKDSRIPSDHTRAANGRDRLNPTPSNSGCFRPCFFSRNAQRFP